MNPFREEALFTSALAKPAAERAAWLDRECSGQCSEAHQLLVNTTILSW